MATPDRRRLLRQILTRPHRYRRARAITMSITLAILFGVPLSGLARLDLWGNAHWRGVRAILRRVQARRGVVNPLDYRPVPKVGRVNPRCLPRESAERLLRFVQNYQWKTEFDRVRNLAIVATMLTLSILNSGGGSSAAAPASRIVFRNGCTSKIPARCVRLRPKPFRQTPIFRCQIAGGCRRHSASRALKISGIPITRTSSRATSTASGATSSTRACGGSRCGAISTPTWTR